MLARLKKQFLSHNRGEHQPDKVLIWSVLILLLFGLVMLFSASSVVSYDHFGKTYYYFLHQLIILGIGLIAFWFFSRIDYHLWKRFAFPLLIFSILLLLLVFIPGIRSEHGSARSWIVLFGYSFQPSELVKLFFLIYLATWLEVKRDRVNSWSGGTFPFLVILGIIGLLMVAQPDVGTLFIIIASAIAVFFVGGGKFIHIFLIGMIGIMLLLVMHHVYPAYQLDRIKCVQDSNYSPQDKCYQINQSLIAVGSGGWFGRGIGQSRQKFMYLPEVWGDSIFPIIAEELGFVFTFFLLVLYLFIFYRALIIARTAPDIYGSSLALGVVTWLSVQMFLNIGGMIRLIPMTGVPLPFISAGGSAIVSALIAMGIIINISKQTK